MIEKSTSQILVFARPDYSLAAIADALAVLPDSIWAITDEKSIKIDTIRRLQQELSTTSASDRTRQVVIYPAEKITEQAQQALLKIIEEPPVNTQITLVTTSVSSVLPTIQSRCRVKIVAEHSMPPQSLEDSVFLQLLHCNSWQEVVTLSQKLPSKREELRPLLQLEYTQNFPSTSQAILYRETLAEVLDALDHNVQPSLCLEKLLFHTYQKAAE